MQASNEFGKLYEVGLQATNKIRGILSTIPKEQWDDVLISSLTNDTTEDEKLLSDIILKARSKLINTNKRYVMIDKEMLL